MPEAFKATYPFTALKYFIKIPRYRTPKAVPTQNKHHLTYGGLFGIATLGAISFISELYEGSTSEKEIVWKSFLLTIIFLGE